MYRHWKFASIPVVLGLALAACPGPEEQAPGPLELVTGSTSVVLLASDAGTSGGTDAGL